MDKTSAWSGDGREHGFYYKENQVVTSADEANRDANEKVFGYVFLGTEFRISNRLINHRVHVEYTASKIHIKRKR